MSDPDCIEGPVKPPIIHRVRPVHITRRIYHGFLHPVHHLPRYIRVWALSTACTVAGAGAITASTLVVRHWPLQHSIISRHVLETQIEPMIYVSEPSSAGIFLVGLTAILALTWMRKVSQRNAH